jgi:hypothetical protein
MPQVVSQALHAEVTHLQDSFAEGSLVDGIAVVGAIVGSRDGRNVGSEDVGSSDGVAVVGVIEGTGLVGGCEEGGAVDGLKVGAEEGSGVGKSEGAAVGPMYTALRTRYCGRRGFTLPESSNEASEITVRVGVFEGTVTRQTSADPLEVAMATLLVEAPT